MQIAVITSNFPSPARPNHGTFVQQFVWALARQGAGCTVIHPANWLDRRFGPLPPTQSSEDPGGEIVRVLRPRWLSYSSRRVGPFHTARLSQRSFDRAVLSAVQHLPTRPDVLYGHFLYASGSSAVTAGRHLGIPAVPAIGEGTFWTVEPFGFERARRQFSDALGMVCVSTEIARNTTQLLGVPRERLGVFPNGIDPKFFFPRPRAEMRARFGFPQDRFLIAFVGTFDTLKGGIELIEAVRPLDNVGLLLVGDGPVKLDSPHTLFRGRVPQGDVPCLLSAADIFVLPTQEEGSCNAVIEAMACGLPIVTATGAYMDDLVDDEIAIRVNPKDVTAIRGAIQTLMEDPGNRRTLSEASLKRSRRFDIDERARRVLSWIEGRLKERESHGHPRNPSKDLPL